MHTGPPSSVLDGNSGVVVLLMGQTGVGKSHFINVAAGKDIAPVYHSLAYGSSTVSAYRVSNPGIQDLGDPKASVIFVDTPGLDNYYLNDLTILQKIRSFITDRFKGDVKFGGILYLQDITCNRTWPVERFISPEGPRRLLLVTSNWDDQASAGNFEKREQALVKGCWKGLLDKGAKYHRFLNTQETAWEILDDLLQTEPLPMHVLERDLKKIQNSLPRKKPRWQITIRNLLPRLPSMPASIAAQVVLSKDGQYQEKAIVATAEAVFTAVPHRPDSDLGTESVISATDTACSETTSVLSTTHSTFFTTFDSESILSSADTGFFTAIEPVDSDNHNGSLASFWPDETESMYPDMETVNLSISQDHNASILTDLSTSTSSSFTTSTPGPPTPSGSSELLPLSTSTTIPTALDNPSLSERNISRDVERVVTNIFQSANRLNIQNLNITVNIFNNQDMPPDRR